METKDLIIIGAIVIICLLIGHIVGYRTRKREERLGRLSVIVDSRFLEEFKKSFKGAFYKGENFEDIEVRAVNVEASTSFDSKGNSNEKIE